MSGVGGKQRELRIIRAAQVVLGILGLALTGLYAGAMLDGYVNSRVALGEFQAEMAPARAESKEAVLPKNAQLRRQVRQIRITVTPAAYSRLRISSM